MNLYGFANGDPVNFSDPFGLSSDNPCQVRDFRCLAFMVSLRIHRRVRETLGDFVREGVTQGVASAATGGFGPIATRVLRAADFSIDGLKVFDATMSVSGGKATVLVSYFEGKLSSFFGLGQALKSMAAAEGAQVLRVEARLANQRLYKLLAERYGLKTVGGVDYFEIVIK
jgi:hypothetical protein